MGEKPGLERYPLKVIHVVSGCTRAYNIGSHACNSTVYGRLGRRFVRCWLRLGKVPSHAEYGCTHAHTKEPTVKGHTIQQVRACAPAAPAPGEERGDRGAAADS